MIPILMKQPPRPDDADIPVTMVFSAACPVPVWPAFEERFGLRICEGYAAVDGGGYTVTNPGSSPPGSIGIPRRQSEPRGSAPASQCPRFPSEASSSPPTGLVGMLMQPWNP